MTKHTPTPWEACERGDYSDYAGKCVVILGDDARVAVVFDDADAAHIVQAVNAHEALVKLVRAIATNPNVRMINPDTEPQLAMLLAGIAVGSKSRAKTLLEALGIPLSDA